MKVSDSQLLFQYLLRLGDDRLILGHRISEWCGHAPILEEDIALANIALDCLGQATALLRYAGEVEDEDRSEDDLAYFREAVDYRNALLMEQPNGDFAQTMVRQFLVDAATLPLYQSLIESKDSNLAGMAAKFQKEVNYHLRHSREWVKRLAGGTEESHTRTQRAVDALWRFTAELFEGDDVEQRLSIHGVAVDRMSLHPLWKETVEPLFSEAGLKLPPSDHQVRGGREGRHSEHLGHLLAEMQIVARSFPGVEW